MGRAPCCDKTKVKRGPWSLEEDTTLKNFIQKYGTGGNWIAFPHKAGLKRCGKSCRLRWLNYLRPNIKHGGFTDEEDKIISTLYQSIGSRWSIIASQLSGRTDNDVKNYWNTKLKKKFFASASNTCTTSSHVTARNNDQTYNSLPHEAAYYPESSRKTFISRPDIALAPSFQLSGVTKYPGNLKSNEFNSSSFTPNYHEAVSSLSESSTSVNNSASLNDFADLGSDLSSLDHFLSAFDFDGINQSFAFSPYSSLEDDETHFTFNDICSTAAQYD